MGWVFKRKYKDKNGKTRQTKTWYIKYYYNGQQICESSKSTRKDVARDLLKKREGDIVDGKAPPPKSKVKFDDLVKLIVHDYQINGLKSSETLSILINHLTEHFGGMPVAQITPDKIDEYILKRKTEGKSNATINRHISALRRMFTLGIEKRKIREAPKITELEEKNIKKGFFEYEDFLRLRGGLPDHLKPIATFGYKLGWRISELRGRKWSHVDRKRRTIRLDPYETKNDEGRTAYLDTELKEIVENLWERRKLLAKVSPYLFTDEKGDPVREFRKTWNKACRSLKLGYGYAVSKEYVKEQRLKGLKPGPTFHDFRRSAVRNMVRAGIPESIAMKVSGHLTREIFERYNISNEKDLEFAAQQQETYLESQ